jgi:hypothetical protein
MGFSFNPIQDGDWQGLNIVLEQLSYKKAEAQTVPVPQRAVTMDASDTYVDGYVDDEEPPIEEITPTPTPTPTPSKRELRKQKREQKKAERKAKREARKNKTTELDSSQEYPDGNPTVPMVNTVSVVSSKGLDIYNVGSPQENVTLPYKGVIHKTLAGIAIPSSYYLDLRTVYVTTVTQKITADYLTLHNSSGLTVAIDTVDETNNVGTAGPIAGGRDQVAAFSSGSWVYFFIIFNPATQDVSSLSSASPTAPTLPSGYTYFVRVGSTYFSSGAMRPIAQINDKSYICAALYGIVFNDTGPTIANTLQSVDLSAFIPPTAKVVIGAIGGRANAAGYKGVEICSDDSGLIGHIYGSINPANAITGLVDGVHFEIPVLTSQTIWWSASTDEAIYGMRIIAFIDDL